MVTILCICSQRGTQGGADQGFWVKKRLERLYECDRMYESVFAFDLARYHRTQKIRSSHAPTPSNPFG